jgi:hypothetical protein
MLSLGYQSPPHFFAGYPAKSVEYMEKSLEKTPPKIISPVYPPYYLWIYKGVDELLFLGDVEAAKKLKYNGC